LSIKQKSTLHHLQRDTRRSSMISWHIRRPNQRHFLIDLQNELASLITNFGEQADVVSDFLTGDARQTT
jgi:predicted 2-oxoglutarate/Fe(II)-dependent dioxygenase YbiX